MVRFIVSKEMYKDNNPTGKIVVVSNTMHKSVTEAIDEMKTCASDHLDHARYRTTNGYSELTDDQLFVTDPVNQLIICKYMVMRCTF